MLDPRLLVLTKDAPTWRNPLNEACALYEIDTPRRQAMFMAQCAHESAGFALLVESLRYSADGLLATWPRRFTPSLAQAMAFDQEAIANHVYGNRNGNGPPESGDGWKYRGRGLLQVTGRANYRSAGCELGLDLEERPESLEMPPYAALSAGWIWRLKGCNELADADDFEGTTRRINGGDHGASSRANWLAQAEELLR